jgi:hypothetical protein
MKASPTSMEIHHQGEDEIQLGQWIVVHGVGTVDCGTRRQDARTQSSMELWVCVLRRTQSNVAREPS